MGSPDTNKRTALNRCNGSRDFGWWVVQRSLQNEYRKEAKVEYQNLTLHIKFSSNGYHNRAFLNTLHNKNSKRVRYKCVTLYEDIYFVCFISLFSWKFVCRIFFYVEHDRLNITFSIPVQETGCIRRTWPLPFLDHRIF